VTETVYTGSYGVAARRILVTLASVTGWGLAELEGLMASRALRLSLSCLEHLADELEAQLTAAAMPVALLAGKSEAFDHAWHRILRMRGGEVVWDPQEAAGIKEIEREMCEAYPWYEDSLRLDRVWREYGSSGPKRNPDQHSRMVTPPGFPNLITGM